jgi:ABC-type dipeptide/oligopeptide/nickel transport system permease component
VGAGITPAPTHVVEVTDVARYVLERVLGIIGVLIAVSIITFGMMHLVPGGPFDTSEKMQRPLPENVRKALMEKYNLDKPVYVQYLSYMGKVLQGDFGISFKYGDPVTKVIARGWPTTAKLGLLAITFSVIVGIGMGMLAALKPNSWLDYITSVTVVTWIVTPVFVIAILMIYVFSIKLRWLPTGGWGTPKQAIMPVFVFMLAPAAALARMTRHSMLDVLHQDYIRTARAKGLTERMIVIRHALRNAFLPILTVLGPMIATMITGSFFIETIFNIPGIGNQGTFAVYNRDYPMIMAFTLLWTTLIAVSYLVTDLLYGLIDPRIRLGSTR